MSSPAVKIKNFTDLITWQEAHKLVILIYTITKNFPSEEKFGLISQMRRSAISISSNIAEGFGRQGYKEKIKFYYLAQGSLTELKNQIIIAYDIHYLAQEKFTEITEQINHAHRLLQGLITKSKTFLNPKS
ncbi:four helix bundle protein [Candidatus Falkowbacteria bacterium]|nr:four helix bundle protein [Candidatus Falkowbacteria bacterium]